MKSTINKNLNFLYMISLEEITIPENFPKHKIQEIENRIRNIQTDFQSIKKDSRLLAEQTQKSISSNQKQIIE